MIQKALDDLAETGIALNGFSFFTTKQNGRDSPKRKDVPEGELGVRQGQPDGRTGFLHSIHILIHSRLEKDVVTTGRWRTNVRPGQIFSAAERVVELRWIRTVALLCVCVSLPKVYRSGSQHAWVGVCGSSNHV